MKNSSVKIIAEIGVNHNGNFKKAIQLIDRAKKSGADFVKFQIFNAEKLVTLKAKKAPYQRKYEKSKNQYLMLKKLELNKNIFKKLIKYSKKKKIQFLATPFDLDSLDFLKKQKVNFIKVSSGDINNFPLLEKIGNLKKKVFLSTGMSKIKEIKDAIKILTLNGTLKRNITIFHCTSSYPTSIQEANLKVLTKFKKVFGKNIGYSDHTKSTIVPCFAVLLGAMYIEKHITLNNKEIGPDHKSSLEPKDFKQMINFIKELKISLGSSDKKVTKGEKKNLIHARRSIYAQKKIMKGEVFSFSNIIAKRPSGGLSPMVWKKIIGRKAKKNFKLDDKIII